MPIDNLTLTSFVYKGRPIVCCGCGCSLSAGERVYPLGRALFCTYACREYEMRNSDSEEGEFCDE